MSLREKLAAMKKEKGANIPADAKAIMAKATEELVKSGITERVLKAGTKAPAFTLADEKDQELNSLALLAGGPLVVSFYRGIW